MSRIAVSSTTKASRWHSLTFFQDTSSCQRPRTARRSKTAAKTLSAGATTRFQRLKLSTDLLADTPKNKLLADFATQIASLDINQRHYWIGTFYTLLLPPAVRRAQAAYFTPPHLSEALLGLVRGEGFDPLRQSAIDPAAGGAAFLSTLAGQMHALGMKPRQIIGRLRGFEIDRGLASLSERLIGDRIGTSIADGSIVSVKEALRAKLTAKYDLVIANPPYGRVSPADVRDDVWQHVCHPGHLNKYALFTELASGSRSHVG